MTESLRPSLPTGKTKLSFCEPGKGTDTDCGKCLTSTDYKYLISVRDALTDLFVFIEEENKRQGYSFANTDEKINN